MTTLKASPIAVASAVMFASAPLFGAFGANVIAKQPAVTPTSAQQAAAAVTEKARARAYVLKTGMADGKMVYIDDKGKVNPVLVADVGDTVEITLASGEGAEHDLVVPDLKVQSKNFDARTGPTKLTFKVTQAGRFTYYCSIPGHRQIGMEGVLEVRGPAEASGAKEGTRVMGAAAAATPAAAQAAIAPAAHDAVSIAMDPAAVPAPLGTRAPKLVKYSIETVELKGRLDDGTTFTYWTFARKVPGPMLRVKQGDTVEVTLTNNAASKAIHSIDLHSVTGGHGGGSDTQVAPGQSKTIRFQALNPGLYVYHCATPSVAHHISAGMYGLILVEPPAGLPRVDREYYVMQGDLYTNHAFGTKGHHEYSPDRAADELPTYYTFNGAVGALTKEFKLTAKVGETVRVFFGVGGPNKASAFHAIGEIFDKVYSEGSVSSVKKDVQTTLVAPGGATIVDFKLNYPGKYLLVDHALSRAAKGLGAVVEVAGKADATVYDARTGKHEEHLNH